MYLYSKFVLSSTVRARQSGKNSCMIPGPIGWVPNLLPIDRVIGAWC